MTKNTKNIYKAFFNNEAKFIRRDFVKADFIPGDTIINWLLQRYFWVSTKSYLGREEHGEL